MCQKKRKVLWSLFILIIFLTTGWIVEAQSQEKYPTRSIDWICPWSPGGLSDLYARMVADALKKKWGVPVNVINKTGGGGVPAALFVYQAAPDGYTMFLDNVGACSCLEIGIKDLPFKVLNRTFVCMIASAPGVIVGSPKLPYDDFKSLVADARKDPGNFTWVSVGTGSDYPARQFFKNIGVDIRTTKPVVCSGGMGEGNQLLAGGHIKMGIDASSNALTHVKGGLIKALAIAAKSRMPEHYPGVPTTTELGYPGIDWVWWCGVSGPPKLPSHIVKKWEETVQEVLRDPEFSSRVTKDGTLISYLNSSDFREFVRKEKAQAAELWGVK